MFLLWPRKTRRASPSSHSDQSLQNYYRLFIIISPPQPLLLLSHRGAPPPHGCCCLFLPSLSHCGAPPPHECCWSGLLPLLPPLLLLESLLLLLTPASPGDGWSLLQVILTSAAITIGNLYCKRHMLLMIPLKSPPGYLNMIIYSGGRAQPQEIH